MLKKRRSNGVKKLATRQGSRPTATPTDTYELTFVGGYDGGPITAELTSPLLDLVLHPDGTLRLTVNTQSTGTKSKPKFLLDAFHVDSVVEYLRSQRYVRSVLEKELRRDRQDWDEENRGTGTVIWGSAKLLSLNLRRRKVPSAEARRVWKTRFKMSAKEIAEIIAASDKPTTRSFFALSFKCDWDAEHLLRAEFRDGKFLGLDHE